MNICLSTIGGSWTIVPELVGFIAPGQYDFYRHHPQHDSIDSLRQEYAISPADELWLITTSDTVVMSALHQVERWHQAAQITLPIRAFTLEGIADLETHQQSQQMRDAVLRLCSSAARICNESSGELCLSLAGGRKNMSADMQYGATIFGTKALLHITSGNLPQVLFNLSPENWREPPESAIARLFTPAVIDKIQPSPLAFTLPGPKPLFAPDHTRSHQAFTIHQIKPGTEFLHTIQQRQQAGQNLHYNLAPNNPIYLNHSGNYTGLFSLSPQQVEYLQQHHIGRDPQFYQQETALLHNLPKYDLHCHLGGILTPKDILTIAEAHSELLKPYQEIIRPAVAAWLPLLENADYTGLWQKLRQQAAPYQLQRRPLRAMKYIIPIPEPLGLCAFLHLFNNDHEALTCFIYGEFVDDKVFTAIGFENYEAIGDLQGSNLLQSELAVELAIETLFRNSRHDNLAYLELRSNISNICRNILTPTQAFGLLCRQLEKQCRSTGIDARLIITASRHRDTDQISTLINTVCTIMQNPELTPWLAGLDLAGDEQAMKPEEVRKAFLPALHQCLHVTIHAGENQPVENIWAAAYHLSAERIGHGLTLRENHSLLSNFRDRGIDLEMCPTSNHQIVGYPQFPLSDNDPGNYPLQHYLQQGLNVTVNTDNPGISQTNASKELYRAASMSFNGLSLLDIAQIIKNGFSAAFLPHSTRKQLLLSTEQNLVREYYRISSRQANL